MLIVLSLCESKPSHLPARYHVGTQWCIYSVQIHGRALTCFIVLYVDLHHPCRRAAGRAANINSVLCFLHQLIWMFRVTDMHFFNAGFFWPNLLKFFWSFATLICSCILLQVCSGTVVCGREKPFVKKTAKTRIELPGKLAFKNEFQSHWNCPMKKCSSFPRLWCPNPLLCGCLSRLTHAN